ncbi:MAG: XdhC family protein [Pseudonocardia sp.]
MSTAELRSRIERLRAERTPFVLATVVRAERPTSARAGDSAVVLPDGSMDGFVGGACAESSVRLEGLRLLRAGESGLLRVTPTADLEPVPTGIRVVGNPCLSGGTLEIFLEAVIPRTLVRVFGDSPVARALVRLGTALDLDVRCDADPAAEAAPDTTAVVVAAHGRDEEPVLRAALAAKVPYVALVASPRRAAAVLAGLDVAEADKVRIRAPAGLDIGARTPEEIALSVYAELVSRRPRPPSPTAAPGTSPGNGFVAAPRDVRDPVCGMTVVVVAGSIALTHGGRVRYFCGTGCREAFRADPTRYP